MRTELFSEDERRIVVAEELMPSDTIELDLSTTVGIVTQRGGKASHAAILARALGDSGGQRDRSASSSKLAHGDEISYRRRRRRCHSVPFAKRTLEDVSLGAAVLCAARFNIVPPVEGNSRSTRTSTARTKRRWSMEAQGEGDWTLPDRIRTACALGRLLSEDEQCTNGIPRPCRLMEGKPVYIRLYDFGADKAASFLESAGRRQSGDGLSRCAVACRIPAGTAWATQARALARASVNGRNPPDLSDDCRCDAVPKRLREQVRQQSETVEGSQLQAWRDV